MVRVPSPLQGNVTIYAANSKENKGHSTLMPIALLLRLLFTPYFQELLRQWISLARNLPEGGFRIK